jgi:hypothetical protein
MTRGCTCTYGERPLGTFNHVNMGRGTVRLTTTPNCPVHDSCRGFTAAARDCDNGRFLYCPIHRTKDCPDG